MSSYPGDERFAAEESAKRNAQMTPRHARADLIRKAVWSAVVPLSASHIYTHAHLEPEEIEALTKHLDQTLPPFAFDDNVELTRYRVLLKFLADAICSAPLTEVKHLQAVLSRMSDYESTQAQPPAEAAPRPEPPAPIASSSDYCGIVSHRPECQCETEKPTPGPTFTAEEFRQAAKDAANGCLGRIRAEQLLTYAARLQQLLDEARQAAESEREIRRDVQAMPTAETPFPWALGEETPRG